MKITNVTDIDGLFAAIDKCKGKVELVTGEGDRLNLKSNLCKYVALAKLFSGESGIDSMEIMCSEPEDIHNLMVYLVQGKTS